MSRTVVGLIAGLAVIGVVAAPSAHAESHFSFYFGTPAPVVVAPPPVVVRPAPVVVAPPADDDCYWQPGYYTRIGYDYRWVPGQWVPRGYRLGWDRRWERDRERWERERWRGNDDRDDQGRGWANDREWRR